MKQVPLTEISALGPFVDYLSARGVEIYRYSDAARIPRGLMESLEGRITKVQATNFLELSREGEGLEDLGFRVGCGFGPEHMGTLGAAMGRSATLADALNLFCLHLRDWWGGTRAWVSRQGDSAWLRVMADDGLRIARDVANQNGVFILTRVIQQAAGEQWTPTRLRIPETKNRGHERFCITGEAEPFFDREEIAVEFPASLLAEPVRFAPIAEDCDAPMPEHPKDPIEALSEALRSQILHGTVPTAEVAAEMVHCSKRTLQRRLGEEALTYRRLIERIQFGIARDHLIDEPRTPLKEIARSAGFSAPGSLVRSWRRMTGMTPGEYRLKQRQS